MVIVKCKHCGKEFKTKPSRIKKGAGKYCSYICMFESSGWRDKHSGENSSRWRGGLIELACIGCGKKFKRVYLSDVKRGCGKYCSKGCYKSCGKLYRGENSHHWKGGNIKRTCQECGRDFDVAPTRLKIGRGKYCSIECRSKSLEYRIQQIGENCYLWKGGSSFFPYSYKFTKYRKESVRNLFDKRCVICGKHEDENILDNGKPMKLCVHHIYHDKSEGSNGLDFHLVPMCISCHGKELHDENEYRGYINKTLDEMFKWGIISKDEYMRIMSKSFC